MTASKPMPEQLAEELQSFIDEMPEMLDRLLEVAASAGVHALDFSFDSLDRIEALYALALDGKLGLPEGATVDKFTTTIARYLGETVIRRIGGRWSLVKSTKDINYGQPSVVELPGLPRSYEFLPLVVVRGYRRSRRPGWLRSRAEQHDLAALRASAATFGRETERELRALMDYVAAHHPAALPLDFTEGSIDRVEQVLSTVLDEKLDARATREVMDEVARYLGEVFRRRAGGEWELCEDPTDGNFGEMRIGGFAPFSIVRNFELRRQPGLLKRAIASVLSRAR
jgi:hypothetical protein